MAVARKHHLVGSFLISLMVRIGAAYSCGRIHPVVSGILKVVAPSSMTSASTRDKYFGIDRPASSTQNSTSSYPSDLVVLE